MKNTLLFLLLMGLGKAMAQQEYTYTFFGDNTAFFNPAATGANAYGTLTGNFRKQWVGFDGSPTSGGVAYEAPLKKYNMGLGGMIYQDHIGVTNQTHVSAMYSYHLRLNKTSRLAFGVNAGMDLVNTKNDQLVYWDLNDEVFVSDYVSQLVPHIGAGAYYYSEKLYAGISLPRMMSVNSDQFNAASLTNAPVLFSHYYLSAGYNVRINDDFSIRPSMLVKYVRNIRPQVDISVLSMYKDLVGMGLAYKSLGFASVMMKYHYKDAVVFGYAFDFSLNPLQQYSKGSHEIMLQYRFGFAPFKQKGNASID